MYQELGSAMTHQLRIFEDSNQQAAQSIELHGKHAREGLTEANLRFGLLENRCATIDERLLEQHDRLLDKIEKVTLSVDFLAVSTGGKKGGDASGGQAKKASYIADRLVELEQLTGCMVPVEEINKMFEYEHDQREAGLKHMLTSVIEENLKGLKGLENTVNKRFDDEASARSKLEKKITSSLATPEEGLPPQTEFVARLEQIPASPQILVAVTTEQQLSAVPGVSTAASSGTPFRQPMNKSAQASTPTFQPIAATATGFARPHLGSPPRSPPQSPASSRVSSLAAPPSNAMTDVSRLQPVPQPGARAQAWPRLSPVLRSRAVAGPNINHVQACPIPIN